MPPVPERPEPSLLDAAEVVAGLGSDEHLGLTQDEAARRLAEHGPNELTGTPPVPRWRSFLAEFQDPLIYLLLGGDRHLAPRLGGRGP